MAEADMMVTGTAKKQWESEGYGQQGDVLQVQVWVSMNTEVPFFFVTLLKKSKRRGRDFPIGPVVNNPHSGSILGQGTKILHAKEQLSPQARTRQSMCDQRSRMAMKIPRATTKTQNIQINTEKKKSQNQPAFTD